jgi:hypothetical protein
MSKPWSKIKWQMANAKRANAPFADLFTYKRKLDPKGLSNEELQEQFTRCRQWQDADQWDHLAIAYQARGYLMNALYCFRQADQCRGQQLQAVSVETAESQVSE